MVKTVLITGADRGLGYGLCAKLVDRDWRVYAGQYLPDWPALATLREQYPDRLHIVPLDVSSSTSVQNAIKAVAADLNATMDSDCIDMLISNAGISGGRAVLGQGLNFEAMQRAFDINSLGGLRVTEAVLPMMQKGLRRLCFVSSEAGCVALAHRTTGFGYGMSKTALNMAIRIMHNELYSEGFTFRLYHPGAISSYMSGTKSTRGDMEPEEAAAKAIPFFLNERDDEGRLVMIDYQGLEWPF